jgi:hypothetical protein
MPKHISIQPGQLYPQPNYSLAVDREGKWTATQLFLCHRNSAVQLMPRPGTPHLEIPLIPNTDVRITLEAITRTKTMSDERPLRS